MVENCATFFLYIYRSPSQTRDTFETFVDNLELTLDTRTNKKCFLILTIGDFNAKATNWHKSNKTTCEGLKINAFASQFGLQQLMN